MGFHVLIVEDNADGADSMAMYLRMFGFNVDVAYTGEKGVAQAKNDPPDAVLCDINLPGIDGFSVARQLRASLPKAPVLIAVTAREEKYLLAPAGDAGFDHFFLKPADPVEIGGLLSEYADRGDCEAAPKYGVRR